MKRELMVMVVIVLMVLWLGAAGAANADGWTDKLSLSVIGAPNEGTFLGGGLSYQWHEHGWVDAGYKHSEGQPDAYLGVSTDLQAFVAVIEKAFDISIGSLPDGVRGGGGYLFRSDDVFAYFAYGISF